MWPFFMLATAYSSTHFRVHTIGPAPSIPVFGSGGALLDLQAIGEYIGEDPPAYAGAVVKAIVQQTRLLAQFPRSGRKVPEFDDENIRELLAYSYRMIYRLQENDVVVAAVIHGKRILQ